MSLHLAYPYKKPDAALLYAMNRRRSHENTSMTSGEAGGQIPLPKPIVQPKEATSYEPEPLDTSAIVLSAEILALTEMLARNTHDVWARQRIAEGWRYGPQRDDARKEHPGLVPYEELSDSEKEYDRNTALQTLQAIIALGYRIEKPP
jgi:RyR domain